MRLAARVDANHTEIIAAFRKFGCSVWVTHQIGKGFPDCIVSKRNKTILVEIKDGAKVKSAQALTKDEVKFHETWQGIVVVVRDLGDVIAVVNGLEKT